MNRLSRGFLAGLLATFPMTVWMLLMNKLLPRSYPDPLPPEEVTVNLTKKAGIEPLLNQPQIKGLSLLNHFLYGGALATPFSLIISGPQKRHGQFTQGGLLYGLLVWGGNYLGLLPSLNLFPPATKRPPRMNGLMIAAHLIWGGSMGFCLSRLTRRTFTAFR